MKKIIVAIAETVSDSLWIFLLLAIPFLIGIYLSVQIIKEAPSFFINELITVCVLATLIGIISAIFTKNDSPDTSLYSIFGIVITIILTIINYKILFNEEKVIYKILAFISMMFPSMIITLAFIITATISSWITLKIKSA